MNKPMQGIGSNGSREDMLGDAGENYFPSELMRANETFEAALANCVIRDEEQRNAIITLAAQFRMFDMTDGLQDLINFLNGSISIGGYSRVLSVSAHNKVLYPSALGVKLSKEGEKAWAGAALEHKRRYDQQEEGGEREGE